MEKVSVYRDVKDMAGNQGWYLPDILHGIKNGKWKQEVEAVRALYPSRSLSRSDFKEAKKPYTAKKATLPNFTISGLFVRCENDKIATYSGFIGIDFDELEDVDTFLSEICADTYTYAAFRSVSGNGVCVIVKVERDKFAEAFLGLEKYYMERYGYPVDPSGKNLARRRFVSYDPDLYLREGDVPTFKLYPQKPKASKRQEKPLFFVNTRNDLEHIFRQLEDNRIDLTTSYDDWYQLGFAFINEFGEGGLDYFVRVSQFHPAFDRAKCERKFDMLLRQKPRTVTIAKFYSLAKKAGIDILSDKTKHIAKIAQLQKKQGSSRDSVISTLEKMDSIPYVESKPIVDAVFDSGAQVETDESVIDKIEMYINREHRMRRNLIKHRLEYVHSGENIDDCHEATIYIKLKQLHGKEITRTDVQQYMMSTMIEDYNPLTLFFERNKHRKSTGTIQQLANSITPKLNAWTMENLPMYVKYYLTRWLIGIVASVHGDPSPLVLVLTGEGNTGKTWFFRHLLPQELREYYAESRMDGGKDDDMLMYTKLIVMNDEYAGSGKEAKHFKNLTSKERIQIRKVYGRHSESIPRLCVFCGTSNETEVINDPSTDNRRVIPIEVVRINHDLYNSIDKTDLLMEAYHLWKDGYSHHLNREEIIQLKNATHQFHEYSDERELIMKYFRKPDENDSQFVQDYLSATEIKIIIEKESAQRISQKRLAVELKAMGYAKDNKKVHGEQKRGYYVIRS